MDLLEIVDREAYLCLPDEERKLVSQVTTEDINKALGVILGSDDVELSDDGDSAVIANPAQKIMFEQLRISFKEVYDSRDAIQAEVNSVFSQAEAKYFKAND